MNARTMDARQALLLLAHVVLLLSAAALVLSAELAGAWRLAWLAVVTIPLLAAVPGLLARRRYTLQWLSIVLVLYVTGGIMEVLAAAARFSFATLMLFAALVELALILHLVRRAPTTE